MAEKNDGTESPENAQTGASAESDDSIPVLEGDYVESETGNRPKRRGRWIPWVLVLVMAVFIGGLFAAPYADRQLQRAGLPSILPAAESTEATAPAPSASGPETAALAETLERVESRLSSVETAVNQISQESSAAASGLSDLSQRIADLERTAPAANGNSTAALERLDKRLSTLSERFDERLSGLSDRLSGLEDAQAEAAGAVSPEEVANLTEAVEAASAERRRLAGQVETLTRRLATLEAVGRTGARQAPAVLSGLLELSQRLEAGRSYADALADVRETVDALPETARVGSQAAFAALGPKAEDGVASRAELLQRFDEVAAAVQRSEPAPDEAGWFERVRRSVASMVVVRSKDADADGTDTPAVLTRAETALARGDLAAAVRMLEELPHSVRAPAADWLADARARLEAERALRALMVIAGAPTVDAADAPAADEKGS